MGMKHNHDLILRITTSSDFSLKQSKCFLSSQNDFIDQGETIEQEETAIHSKNGFMQHLSPCLAAVLQLHCIQENKDHLCRAGWNEWLNGHWKHKEHESNWNVQSELCFRCENHMIHFFPCFMNLLCCIHKANCSFQHTDPQFGVQPHWNLHGLFWTQVEVLANQAHSDGLKTCQRMIHQHPKTNWSISNWRIKLKNNNTLFSIIVSFKIITVNEKHHSGSVFSCCLHHGNMQHISHKKFLAFFSEATPKGQILEQKQTRRGSQRS